MQHKTLLSSSFIVYLVQICFLVVLTGCQEPEDKKFLHVLDSPPRSTTGRPIPAPVIPLWMSHRHKFDCRMPHHKGKVLYDNFDCSLWYCHPDGKEKLPRNKPCGSDPKFPFVNRVLGHCMSFCSRTPDCHRDKIWKQKVKQKNSANRTTVGYLEDGEVIFRCIMGHTEIFHCSSGETIERCMMFFGNVGPHITEDSAGLANSVRIDTTTTNMCTSSRFLAEPDCVTFHICANYKSRPKFTRVCEDGFKFDQKYKECLPQQIVNCNYCSRFAEGNKQGTFLVRTVPNPGGGGIYGVCFGNTYNEYFCDGTNTTSDVNVSHHPLKECLEKPFRKFDYEDPRHYIKEITRRTILPFIPTIFP